MDSDHRPSGEENCPIRDFALQLAGWDPLEAEFRPVLQGAPETLSLVGQIINALNEDWKKKLAEAELEGRRRTVDLSVAYEALQAKSEEMNRDLETARRIQTQLLPQGPEIPLRRELAFAASYQAVDRVGGDLYDLIRIGKNAYAILVADVSGHGLPSALITMLVKAAFRTRVRWGVASDAVCREVNAVLHPIVNELGFFVTAFLGILDLETSQLRYTSCGHNPAILYHKERQEVALLDTMGTILGPFEEIELEERHARLDPGDMLVVYTDGITEARNFMDDQYGETRLINLIRKWALLKPGPGLPQVIVEAVKKDLKNFSLGSPQADDQSLAVLQFLCETSLGHGEEPSDQDLQDQKKRKTLAQGMYQEGVKAYRIHNFAEAETYFRALVSLEPERPAATLLLAVCQFRMGKKKEARGWAREVISRTAEGSRIRTRAEKILATDPRTT